MSAKHPWEGNWRARLYERVRERGYASLTALIDDRPATPLHVVADELGKGDIAAVQLVGELFAEAERRNQVTRFVRDILVREFSDGLPQGWPPVLDDANRFEVALVLARWMGYTPDPFQERARQVAARLLAMPPSPGWRPLGPDDELLRTLLPDEVA